MTSGICKKSRWKSRLAFLLATAWIISQPLPGAAGGGQLAEETGETDRTEQNGALEEERLPLIQAHTGAASLAPENTLAAFRAAKALGADGVETDVRVTKDGQLVIRHDDRIDETSDGSGSISEMTLEELKDCDFGAWFGEEYRGEKILSLEEFLQTARELDFSVVNLELKPVNGESTSFVRLAADVIRNSGISDRVMVSSFDWHLLEKLKDYAPELRAALLTVPDYSAISGFELGKYLPQDKPMSDYTLADVQYVPAPFALFLLGIGARGSSPADIVLGMSREIAAVAPVNATWPEVEEQIQREADLVSFVDSLDFEIDYLNCHTDSLSAELMEAMEARGIGVNVWTPDTEWDLETALSYHPEGIITNAVETALRLREAAGEISRKKE